MLYKKQLKSTLCSEWKELTNTHHPIWAAQENPDILSDEIIYDYDEEYNRRKFLIQLKKQLKQLSPRQKQIVKLIQKGWTQVRIAKELKISRFALYVQLKRVKNKLNFFVSNFQKEVEE